MAERVVLAVAALLLAWALVGGRRGPAVLAACVLVALAGDFTLRFLLDDFSVRQVWLYGAPQLAWYVKAAGLWSGEEGTLLLLAALSAVGAARLTRRPGWGGRGALAVALLFTGAAVAWDPFAATSAAELAQKPFVGGNLHLRRVWMLLHPPFIFAAGTLFLLPWAAALEALVRGTGGWRDIAAVWVRAGWFVLSLGLASGMWWAYEDFTFGQFWHWDPVQTSIFLVWAAATAHLHVLNAYRPDGAYARLHPAVGLGTGVLVLLSMVVTRSPQLASSHRYVGETSLPVLTAAMAVLALALVGGVGWSLRRTVPRTGPRPQGTMTLAALALLACAGVAGAYLGQAYLGAALGWARPAELKPFYETLARFTAPAELETLRQAFAQWEPNPFAINKALAAVGAVVGLIGFHHFVPLRGRRRWLATLGAAAVLAAGVAWGGGLFARLYTGDGMTSGRTVASFALLDALVVALAGLAAALAGWAWRRLRAGAPARVAFGHVVPIAVLHVGVVVALAGLLVATVLDTYSQRILAWPRDFDRPQPFADGFTVAIGLGAPQSLPDGLRSVAEVRMTLAEHGEVLLERTGHAVALEAVGTAAGAAGQGAVRLMCEILDYRYARYAAGKDRLLDPFLHRGLWRDVQVWVPPVGHGDGIADVPVVVKTFPLASWVWVGLVLVLLGAAAAGWRAVAGRR
ncbi:cytochrome c biogenesis protein CcsA [Azospirillum sp.]|uniref:cytochrome c biogenesis protein CcsA n=1 Tax=Azospirillum sp. TaxID=34012 RepID=UPI002D5144E6|nr:cytochrome c biogenesis protein CcsA [Azospirillum sp.]HYD64060.1 cytochrome c biogenesis protein CcsA [Azospirillum sp.]